MYDFLNAIGGMGFAILGAALTVGLCCVGSAKGTGLVGEAAAGLVSEDPDKSTKCLILQVLPGTQGLYGFVALFIVLLQVGLMSGTPVDLTLTQGMSFFAACIPTAIGGWLGYFLGGCDGLLYALLLFVSLDYVTGVLCAIADRKLSSRVGFKGICRKVLIFALVGVGHVLDTHIIGTGSILRTAVIFFYLSNEGLSLIENAAYLGLPIPKKLKAVLEQLHDRAEKEDDDHEIHGE